MRHLIVALLLFLAVPALATVGEDKGAIDCSASSGAGTDVVIQPSQTFDHQRGVLLFDVTGLGGGTLAHPVTQVNLTGSTWVTISKATTGSMDTAVTHVSYHGVEVLHGTTEVGTDPILVDVQAPLPSNYRIFVDVISGNPTFVCTYYPIGG